jgi:hypothetical protein
VRAGSLHMQTSVPTAATAPKRFADDLNPGKRSWVAMLLGITAYMIVTACKPLILYVGRVALTHSAASRSGC